MINLIAAVLLTVSIDTFEGGTHVHFPTSNLYEYHPDDNFACSSFSQAFSIATALRNRGIEGVEHAVWVLNNYVPCSFIELEDIQTVFRIQYATGTPVGNYFIVHVTDCDGVEQHVVTNAIELPQSNCYK